MNLQSLRERADCPACKRGERAWLAGGVGSQTTVLCGRNAVQITQRDRAKLSFADLAEKLKPSGDVKFNQFLLRFTLPKGGYEFNVFADGRAIIKGTDDPAVARSLYARYLGS